METPELERFEIDGAAADPRVPQLLGVTRAPDRIRSLVVQNANAHASGLGPPWAATRRYWDDPTPGNAAEATMHLIFEGTRDQYVGGVPADIAARIDPARWEEDWRVSPAGSIPSARWCSITAATSRGSGTSPLTCRSGPECA